MAREYISGAFANGLGIDGYIDLDFANLSAGGAVTVGSTTFQPGTVLNSQLQNEVTTFRLTETASNSYNLQIERILQGFRVDGTSYDINFQFVSQDPKTFTGGSYYSAFRRMFSTQPVEVQSTLSSSSLADQPFPPVCFVTGTRIRTSRGEVAVEDLQVGDRAITASGSIRPIIWVGHREVAAKAGSLSLNQQPVRVRAGAFGDGLPVRDLFLSPGHPVLVGADADNEGGVLVPLMCLMNGTTILRESRAHVTYWHVELDAHDILLAEGLPAESYSDGGDRAFFLEASDHALHNPDFVVPGWDGRCRPVAVDGPLVEAERSRLDAVFASALSTQCGWDVEVAEWTVA